MNFFSGTSLTCERGGRRVFSGLDFKLAGGESLVLVGPNGSGKSTLLRLLAGLIKPTAGDLIWNGEGIIEDLEAHCGRLQFLGHCDAVKPVFSVAENVSFWASVMNGGSDVKQTTVNALKMFEISHLADIPGRFLSAGQKRRVNLARIVTSPAPLWLLDEPTTSLDKETILILENIISRHCENGGIVVISTHNEMRLPNCQVLDLLDFNTQQTELDLI